MAWSVWFSPHPWVGREQASLDRKAGSILWLTEAGPADLSGPDGKKRREKREQSRLEVAPGLLRRGLSASLDKRDDSKEKQTPASVRDQSCPNSDLLT